MQSQCTRNPTQHDSSLAKVQPVQTVPQRSVKIHKNDTSPCLSKSPFYVFFVCVGVSFRCSFPVYQRNDANERVRSCFFSYAEVHYQQRQSITEQKSKTAMVTLSEDIVPSYYGTKSELMLRLNQYCIANLACVHSNKKNLSNFNFKLNLIEIMLNTMESMTIGLKCKKLLHSTS